MLQPEAALKMDRIAALAALIGERNSDPRLTGA